MIADLAILPRNGLPGTAMFFGAGLVSLEDLARALEAGPVDGVDLLAPLAEARQGLTRHVVEARPIRITPDSVRMAALVASPGFTFATGIRPIAYRLVREARDRGEAVTMTFKMARPAAARPASLPNRTAKDRASSMQTEPDAGGQLAFFQEAS